MTGAQPMMSDDPDPLLATCTVQTAAGPLVVERRRDSWRLLRPVDGSPVDEEVGRYRDAWDLAVHLAMVWGWAAQVTTQPAAGPPADPTPHTQPRP